ENMSREAKFQFICSLSKKLCSLDDNTQSEEFLKKELDEQEQTVLNIDTNPKIVLHAELAPRAEIAPQENIDLNLEGVKAVVQDAAPFIILGFLPVGWAVRGIVGLGHV